MKKKYTYLVIIFLVVASFVAFGRIAGNGFINFDDNGYITENYQIQQGINLQTVKWALTTTYFSYWHPLTWISHMLDWSLFGANASGHHLVSLILHIGAVIFLFLFLYKTTNNLWPSAFAAAFFALHPLRVESVAWASERKDVLSMFFGMASIYAYAFYVESCKLSKYFLCLILFVLSLMSKPMMVTLPFVLLLLDYWPLHRWPKAFDMTTNRFNSALKLVWEKVPFFCLTIAVSIAAVWAQNREGTVASLDYVPILTRAANAAVSYASYLGTIFWPANLAVFYPYEYSLPLWKILISGIILIPITSAVIYYIKKMTFLLVGWFTYLGVLVPVIGLIQVGSQAMADRYTYLPSAGIAVILAWGISSLIRSEKIRRNILFPAALFFILLLTILTWQQCGYWKNSVTLFRHSLNVTKNNALAQNQLGLAFYQEGNQREALYHFNKAVLLEPNQDSAYNNRGAVYLQYGQYQQALNDFNNTISFNPAYVKAYNNRANVYIQKGLYKMAVEDLSEAIRIKPDYILAYFNRGLLFAKLRDYEKAIKDFDRVIILNNNHVQSYSNRAYLYLNMGNISSGCRDAQKACALGNCQILEAAKGKGYCW